MPKINILPPEIISKIAAGEVIERPASVIKELVENSIDAKTDTIEVILRDAGKTLIQIKDTGSGIEHDDLEKIFLRHATSKISKSDDLFAISSLGFRGEALYSVAAISDINLQSKTASQDSGWEIHVRGSERLNLKPCTFANTGTNIEINELFFNTPARRKFLKSNTAELTQILNVFIPYTLLHNNIKFILKHQDKTLLDLADTDNLLDRISDSLNLEKNHLIEAAYDVPGKNISIKMILGDINITRSRRDMQFIFVNGRPVQSKNISFNMNQVYRLIMPDGSAPFFSVYIKMPPEDLDVNIHPAKREIKIKDENHICSILRSVCEQALMSKGKTKQVPNEGSSFAKENPSLVDKALRDSSDKEYKFEGSYSPDTFENKPSSIIKDTSEYTYPRSNEIKEFFIPENMLFEKKLENLGDKLKASNYLGTFMNKYHFLELESSLFIVDQHAAQERIVYEKLLIQMQKGNIESQRLLTPILIKLSIQEIVLYDEVKERLEELGFESNQWDEETIAVHTYPVLIKNPERSVRELLGGDNILKCDFDTVARRACRDSVMAGDRMAKEQVEFQISELTNCLDPFTCPHGRPTVIEMNEDFLNKQFLRT